MKLFRHKSKYTQCACGNATRAICSECLQPVCEQCSEKCEACEARLCLRNGCSCDEELCTVCLATAGLARLEGCAHELYRTVTQ